MNDPIRKGGIYWIPDSTVALPPNTLKDRVQHPRRPFLVVSNDIENTDESWLIVLGFPLSTSKDFSTKFDIPLAAGTASLPEECWIRVPMLQPISKAKLMEQIGRLDANTMEACIGQMLMYMAEL